NFLLSFLGEHHLHELTGERLERLVGRLVDVDVEEARDRVFARVGVLRVGLDTGASLLLREPDRAKPRRGVADAADADTEAVDGDAYGGRLVAELLLEIVDLRILHRA